MMGLEPKTFCMANASDARTGSRPLNPLASAVSFSTSERE
jgi:hypothetical protein